MEPAVEMRLIRLEESGYFQEEKLKALDAQILAQQHQLDKLASELQALRTSLEQARTILSDMTNSTLSQAPETPPHSHSTGWHQV